MTTMSTTPHEVEQAELEARLQRAQAEKLEAETRKLKAEADKLAAEERKMLLEHSVLHRWQWLAVPAGAAALIAVVAATATKVWLT